MTHGYLPSTMPNTRIDAADILRGIAIGGIVLIHFIEHMNFYRFPELTALDHAVWDTVFFLLAGKMYAIFALLFGLSFYVQHDNQAQRGRDFRPRFAWRMVLLMLFGLLDLCFFNGDILFLYAVCGLLVLPLIRAAGTLLRWMAVLLFIQPIELGYMLAGWLNPELQPLDLGSGIHYGALAQAQTDGTFWDVAVAGVRDGLPCNFLWAIENGRMTQTLFLFILGICIGRSRLLYDEGQNAARWKRLLAWSVVGFAVLYPAYVFLPQAVENACISHSLGVMLNMWKNFSMTVFFVSGVTLLYHRSRFGRKLIAIAPYGKMSLTNYLGQSVVGGMLFYGWGFGLYAYCGHTVSLLMGIGFVIVQFLFCRWWLSCHKRGPLEEIWRRGTWI